MASKVLSTEIKDFVIDCVLIINDVFRNILRTRIQPHQLQEKIHACKELKIGYFKLLPEQTAICCPHPHRVPDYDEFDVFLLYNLIRNLCPDLAPTDKWGEIPSDSNEEIGDDIERLRHIRYRLYAILETTVHPTAAYLEYTPPPSAESLESASHSTAEFLESTAHPKPELISRWLELKEALQRTGEFLHISAENEKKIKIIEETYHFIKARGETPKEGEVLGKERKDKTDRREEEEDHDDEEEEEEEEEITPDTPETTLLRTFLEWFKSKYETLKVVRLFLGKQKYEHPCSDEKKQVIVLVIDHSDVIAEKVYQCNGKTYYIVCKLWKTISIEGVKVTGRELDCKLDPATIFAIETCIAESSKSLFKLHSNLEFITMSAFRSRNNGEKIIDEPCIALFCSSKGVVPLDEEEFPTQIDNIPTDIREGFFFQSSGSYPLEENTEVLNPLRMGANIGRKEHSCYGTLGGFVTMPSGDIGFITAAHNFLDVSNIHYSDEKFDVVQPLRGEPNVCGTHVKSFGTRKRFKNETTLDAALVKITNRGPARGIFAGMTSDQLSLAGYSLQIKPEYNDGAILDFRKELLRKDGPCTCIKVGATTGLTKGTLWTVGMSARWMNYEIEFQHQKLKPKAIYYNQLHINESDFHENDKIKNPSLFSQFGDSGAFVFQVDNDDQNKKRLVCIGMVVGFTADNKTVVTPIVPILETLKVKLHNFNTGTVDKSQLSDPKFNEDEKQDN